MDWREKSVVERQENGILCVLIMNKVILIYCHLCLVRKPNKWSELRIKNWDTDVRSILLVNSCARMFMCWKVIVLALC
jgi:hypothetical protein